MLRARFLARVFLGLLQAFVLLASGWPLTRLSLTRADSLPSAYDRGTFILKQQRDGSLSNQCPGPDEATAVSHRKRAELHVITPQKKKPAGLQITLEATAQLETFPQAKADYLTAASHWEELITTPISIVIDVDFGPNVFGTPFPSGAIGAGGAQTVFEPYADARKGLIATADNDQQTMLYNALPSNSVPTDVGALSTIIVPSANARALGLLPAVANPTAEMPTLGPPPAFALNSAAPFDFDPTDGIDPTEYDFEGVAMALIGQILGFTSNVGDLELNPQDTPALSVLDFFRFRPGTTLADFSTAQRIQHSGGDQVFFNGAPEIPFSTGRPDGSGGDGRPAGAWKDNALTGVYLGLFEPNAYFGEPFTITLNDLAALGTIGYTIKPSGAPIVTAASASLNGDVLSVSGTASDSGGPFLLGVINQVQLQLLDGHGKIVATPSAQAVNSDQAASFSFSFQITGLDQIPDAMTLNVVAVDTTNADSAPIVANFSQGDPGGPMLKKASFTNGSLTIKGSGLSEGMQVEVNGVIVAPPLAITLKGAKATIAGSASDLNIQKGANRLRCVSGGLRSNIVILNN